MGAEGEELVARQLSKLDPARWRVVNDIAIGTRGANVDHLVVGGVTLRTHRPRWVVELAAVRAPLGHQPSVLGRLPIGSVVVSENGCGMGHREP